MKKIYFIIGDDFNSITERVNEISIELYNPIVEKIELKELKDLEQFYLHETNLQLFPVNIILQINLSSRCLKYLEKEASQFISFLNTLSIIKTIIILFYTDKMDKSIKKQILESPLISSFGEQIIKEQYFMLKPWQTDQIKSLVNKLANKYNLRFDDKALNLFIDCFKEKLDYLPQELQKLQIYLLPDNFVSYELINKMYYASVNIDNLYISIINQYKSSVKSLADELNKYQTPVYLLASLQFKFRQALQIKICSEHIKNINQISKFVSIHSYIVQNELNNLKNITSKKLKEILYILSDIEYKTKSGIIKNENSLDLFTVTTITK